ncbi:glycosyltransferase family 4 protein [Flavobacterium pallidum]|uniref:Glycosyltransferase family 1 protein n=1 Tax=Flavobacterium pallidum TaxID=2172098 RepID=A0A2S1SH20_9FLAO|nr:glycosyltransferase family 4 protein [Flavobacterium pallidum]AWI25675.1 glycosyltransferase family 1 protein [Flavobacterium pallidum]
MKMAFLTPEYPHPKFGRSGGIGTGIKNLAHALVEDGHQAVVLVYGQERDAFFEENGIQFHCIKNVKLKGISWLLTRKKIQKLINRLYNDKKIDVVEAPDWTGITSFIRTRCPIIIRQNGSDTYFCHLDGRKVKFMNRFHEKKALQNADGVIAVSQFTGDLTNKIFGINLNFTVIPNGIDSHYFDASAKGNSSKDILYFGTIIRKKGLLELPLIFNKVIEEIPDAGLIIIGQDAPDMISGNASTWTMMQDLFSEKALQNTVYHGPKPYMQIRSYIENAAVCVFPSFAEALPLSWLEAMAMGKAIVASDIGWATEMIVDGTDGFLVDPSNHMMYAEKIIAILQDKKLQHDLGMNAREKVQKCFDSKVVLQQNILYYEKFRAE